MDPRLEALVRVVEVAWALDLEDGRAAAAWIAVLEGPGNGTPASGAAPA